MLAQIRAFAKSPVANVLLVILLISFVIFGVRGVSTSVGASDDVVKAGGRTAITSQMFRDRFNFLKQRLEQQRQQPITLQEALQNDVDRRLADELGAEESLAEMLNRIGVRVSDELVAQKLRTIPAFFNPITGAFDKNAYLRLLAQNNMTPLQAEGEIRDEIAQQQFETGMVAGLKAPLTYAAVQAAFLREGRDFSYFSVDPKVLGPPIKPTDAQLNGFIKENAARLMKPEERVLSYVRFSADLLAPTLTIPDADLQKRFAFEKDALSSPEKRTFQQIAVKDQAMASTVAARLKSGADPAAVAKSLGLTAIPFVDQPKAAVPDREVADAAFSMKPGETSGAIKGDLGLSVIHLSAVTPGHAATFAEARPKIEAEARKSAASDKAYQLVQKFDDLRGQGMDLAAAAKAVGATVATTPPVSSKGVDAEGKPLALPPKVLQAAFTATAGQTTDPVNAGGADYYVVHVDKVLPPALPTLDEIRPKLTQFFVLRDTAQKLQARAEALAAAIRKGESLEAAAKSVGASVSTAKNVTRNEARTYSTDLVGKVFAAKTGAVVTGEDTRLAYVVARVDKVDPADPNSLAPITLALENQTTKSLYQDLGDDVRIAARALVKPRIDYARARKAVGGDAGGTPTQ